MRVSAAFSAGQALPVGSRFSVLLPTLPTSLACQCVAGAMYITGFAESISDLLSLRSIWAVRGISVVVLLALLGINLAGVKWIIRLQLLLLFLLAVSTLDFVVGSFTHLDPGKPFGVSRWPSRGLHCFLDVCRREFPRLPPKKLYVPRGCWSWSRWVGLSWLQRPQSPPHIGILPLRVFHIPFYFLSVKKKQ